MCTGYLLVARLVLGFANRSSACAMTQSGAAPPDIVQSNLTTISSGRHKKGSSRYSSTTSSSLKFYVSGIEGKRLEASKFT
jgi:hypothetical protein